MQTVSYLVFTLSIFAGLAYSAQLLYFYYGFKKGKAYKPTINTPKTTVSIIVAARNEESTITTCIHSLLAQNYPSHLMEIIVVDDDSTDATLSQLELLRIGNPIKLIRLNPTSEKGKKAAIAKAINQATHELIVTTDADCQVSPYWITTLVNHYENEFNTMLLGPVAFYGEKNLFEKIQSLEFMALLGITAGSANLGKPLLCNGANLAYTKSAFIRFNGFESHTSIASGDDMLLLQKIRNQQTTTIAFVMSNAAMVTTTAQASLKKFMAQRKRWFTKSLVASDKQANTVAFLVFLMCSLIFINTVVGLVWKNNYFFYYAFALFSLKSLLDFIFLYSVARFFQKTKLLVYFPLAQLFIIVYTISMAFVSITKTYNWKGREVR